MDMSGHNAFAMASALGLRKSMRYPITIEGCLRSSAVGNLKIQLTDISESGCQCKRHSQLAVGTYLTLVIPGLSPCGANVIWVEGDQIGLRFLTKMHRSVVERIVATSSARASY